MVMTATIVSFDGTSSSLAKTAIDSLGLVTASKVISWQTLGNKVYVARLG